MLTIFSWLICHVLFFFGKMSLHICNYCLYSGKQLREQIKALRDVPPRPGSVHLKGNPGSTKLIAVQPKQK